MPETQKYITGNLGTNEGTRAAETLLVKFSRLPPIITLQVVMWNVLGSIPVVGSVIFTYIFIYHLNVAPRRLIFFFDQAAAVHMVLGRGAT